MINVKGLLKFNYKKGIELINRTKSNLNSFSILLKSVLHKKKYGKLNPNIHFLVIKRGGEKQGPGSIIVDRISSILWAERLHCVPVIDFKTSYVNMIQDRENRRKENAWSYYFRQPDYEISIEEVYKSKKVSILQEGFYPPDYGIPKQWEELLPSSEMEYAKWSKIFRRYIRLQPELEIKVDDWYNKLFLHGKKIMGVSIRAGFRAGAEKGLSLYNYHPKVASCDEYIAIVEQKLTDWKCDLFFLQIDDREWCNKFMDYFGERCIRIERNLVHYYQDGEPIYDAKQTTIEYSEERCIQNKTTEYLIETFLLARCDCLYATKGMGALLAYFSNGGKYENVEFYDNGYYSGLRKKKY